MITKQMKFVDGTIAEKRIIKELQEVGKDKEKENHFFLQPVNDENVFECKGIIYGPEHTPFEGGKFVVSMHIPFEYPFKPPSARLLTKIYHPNFNDNFKSNHFLQKDWNYQYSLKIILLNIQQLLCEPNPDDAINYLIAKEYNNDRETYNSIAREWTQKYAS